MSDDDDDMCLAIYAMDSSDMLSVAVMKCVVKFRLTRRVSLFLFVHNGPLVTVLLVQRVVYSQYSAPLLALSEPLSAPQLHIFKHGNIWAFTLAEINPASPTPLRLRWSNTCGGCLCLASPRCIRLCH